MTPNEAKGDGMKDRFQQQVDERQSHRAKLESAHGLTGHPKAGKLYTLAWQMGHSAGYAEVELYYADMADLLMPTKEKTQ